MSEARKDAATDWKQAKESLSHIYWICGSTSAGKSTIATKLADDYGMVHYSGDAQLPEHRSRATEEDYPAMHSANSQPFMTFMTRTLTQPPDKIGDIMREINRERLLMAVEDLRALPNNPKVVAEVFCGDVFGILCQLIDYYRVVFLVSTKDFQKKEYQRRFRGHKGSKDSSGFRKELENCADPEAVFMSGWVQYQLYINQYTRDECRKHNLRLLITGGQSSFEESYKAVCDHFHLSRQPG